MTQSDEYTHFELVDEVPAPWFASIGRCVFAWSQVEAAVFALSCSSEGLLWLDAIKKNFRTNKQDYDFSSIIRRLKDKLQDDNEASLAMAEVEILYKRRKILIHGAWGVVFNSHRSALGIHNWSSDDLSSFRDVSQMELDTFYRECLSVKKLLLEKGLKALHSSNGLSIDDDGRITLSDDRATDL